ncbi:MAG: hypothetical protein ACI4WH_07560 [Oscillospiraceae bacterium]
MSIFFEHYKKSREEAIQKAKDMSWEQLLDALINSYAPQNGIYGSYLSDKIKTMPDEDIQRLIEILKADENWRVIDYIHNALDSRGYPTELVSDLYHSPHYLMKGWSY